MADPMKIRAAVVGDSTEVKVLMSHEMETGQRKDGSGNVVPAHFISNVTVTHGGKTVLSAEWGPAISKNPYLQFKFQGGKKGDDISVTWADTERGPPAPAHAPRNSRDDGRVGILGTDRSRLESLSVNTSRELS